MKKIALTLLFSLSLLHAQDEMLRETPYAIVKQTLAKGKPIFVEAGSDSCHSCQIMGKTLYKIAKKHPSYNINFVNVKKEREAAFALKIQMIPTQLIFNKQGKEVYRHVGILAPEQVEALLKVHEFATIK